MILDFNTKGPYRTVFTTYDTSNKLFGYSKASQVTLNPYVYDFAGRFNEDYALAQRNNKTYVLDANGKETLVNVNYGVIPAKKNGSEPFPLMHLGLFAVEFAPNKFVYINKSGSKQFDDTFDFATDFSENLAIVKKRKSWQLISRYGSKSVINIALDVNKQIAEIGPFHSKLSLVKIFSGKDTIYDYLKTDGTLLNKSFLHATEFHEGLAMVANDDINCTIIDSTGKTAFDLLNASFNQNFEFNNGTAVYYGKSNFNDNYYYKLINKSGAELTKTQFIGHKFSERFSEGIPLMMVNLESPSGQGIKNLMRKNGELELKFNVDTIIWMEKDKWLLKLNSRLGIYDARLHKMPEFEYDEIGGREIDLNYIRAKKNGKWGWIDMDNTIAIPFEYDFITPFVNGFAWVKSPQYGGLLYKIDKHGNAVIHTIQQAEY
jgi:hypothetical protein